MSLDCAIIGGGPAGMNAALVLGRARRKVILFDDAKPRNAVTRHSHGFITRDGVSPAEFRAQGQADLGKYPSIELRSERIVKVTRPGEVFEVIAESGERFEAANIILATGVQETLPAVEGIYEYYGKSLFNCPYCDGWELRDKPLVLITENEPGASHIPKVLYNWSHDIVICTNGHQVLNQAQKAFMDKYGIAVIEDKIAGLVGHNGQLEQVVFETHPSITRSGGLVGVQLRQSNSIGQELGCELNAMGGIAIDEFGRTNIKGVYAAGDTSTYMMAQLIYAAANGSKAAVGLNTDLTERFFAQ